MDYISKIIRESIRKILQEYKYPQGNFQSGQGDFQKAGKEGFKNNGALSFNDNSNYDFTQMLRDIPGVKFPRQAVKIDNSKEYDGIDMNDETTQEIINSILAHSEKYNDRYYFANGVARMLYDGEITSKDFATLSNICQYLSENLDEFNKKYNQNNSIRQKDWEKGLSNFYGLSFKELKRNYGQIANQYVKNVNVEKIKPSSIISSNGYYVYVCYNFSSANSVGSFFTQGMCYLSSDTFFRDHMGDSGVLFMFKQKDSTLQQPFSKFFHSEKTFNELGIATKVKENGEIIIESITNGENNSLYNKEDDVKHSKTFINNDLNDISDVIGTVNGMGVLDFCMQKTKARQNQKYDKILSKSTYKAYLNQYYSNYINTPNSREIDGLIMYKMHNNTSICLDTTKQRVFIIKKEGYITCNGKQVIPNNDNIYAIINNVMSDFYPKWNGFKRNSRNKVTYIDENIIKKIIHETIKRII